MKKICALLLLFFLLCPALSLAEQNEQEIGQGMIAQPLFAGPLAVVPPKTGKELMRRGVTITQTSDGTVPLYAQPDENAEVLMNYYCGMPIEVIRKAGGDFYLVQTGEHKAGLMGYMRAQDIRIGDAAEREVAPCFMRLEFNEPVPVHAYCDKGSPEIGLCDTEHTYYAMSKNDDKWVQLFLPPQPHVWEEEERITYGFVKLETGMARGYWQESEAWEVQPVTGEITREQAIALALDYLADSGLGGMPDVYTDGNELEKMDCRAVLSVNRFSPDDPVWRVYFWQQPQSDAAYAMIYLTRDGGVQMFQGYIAEGAWGGYTITPVL